MKFSNSQNKPHHTHETKRHGAARAFYGGSRFARTLHKILEQLTKGDDVDLFRDPNAHLAFDSDETTVLKWSRAGTAPFSSSFVVQSARNSTPHAFFFFCLFFWGSLAFHLLSLSSLSQAH